MIHEPKLPFNLKAESGVLGSIIIDPDALEEVADRLRPEDFYRDAHRTIYAAILSLHERGMKADYLTLCDTLAQQQQQKHVGGVSYIAGLINEVPTSGNVQHYAEIVLRTAILRRLIAEGTQIVASAYADQDADPSTLLEQAEQAIFAISHRYHGMLSGAVHVQEVLHDYLAWLEREAQDPGVLRGVTTGFSDLDLLLGGLQPSDLIILAGRPSMGKSALALSMAYHAAKLHTRKIGIISLEMSREQVVQRLLSIEAGLDQFFLRNGWMEEKHWETLVAAAGHLSERPIWMTDQPTLTLSGICSQARRWVLTHGIEMLIVDYLQLVRLTPSEGRSPHNREQEVALISRALKALARELKIPVLALAQLSRAAESRHTKVPQLSDLRESGAIENDADVVLLLYREEVYFPESAPPGDAEVIVAKHRNGATGTVHLRFEKAQTYFYQPVPTVSVEHDERHPLTKATEAQIESEEDDERPGGTILSFPSR